MQIIDNFLNKHKKRIVGLDIIRSIAILIVVYEHGRNLMPQNYRSFYLQLQIFRIDGVSIFFVLSGFLIGGILLKVIHNSGFTKRDLLNFWIRRWFRTIPNYFLIILLVVIYKITVFGDYGSFSYKYLLFVQNIFTPHPSFFEEAWSLTIEEWFYISFPIMVFVIHKQLKNKEQSILISAVIFLVLPFLLRVIKYELGIGLNDFDNEFRKIVIFRLDSLMYGVLASYIYYKHPVFWKNTKKKWLVVGIILLVLLNINPMGWKYFYPPFFFNLESITTFCFLPFMSEFRSSKSRTLNVVVIFISIISYSMYLLHRTPVLYNLLPITKAVLSKFGIDMGSNYVINYSLYWIYTMIGSYLVYTLYEYPVTNLREKLKL